MAGATCASWLATSPPGTSGPSRAATRVERRATTGTTERMAPMSDAPSPDLAIIETRVYRGANVWSYDKAIHLVVDLGVARGLPD